MPAEGCRGARSRGAAGLGDLELAAARSSEARDDEGEGERLAGEHGFGPDRLIALRASADPEESSSTWCCGLPGGVNCRGVPLAVLPADSGHAVACHLDAARHGGTEAFPDVPSTVPEER